MHKTDYVEFDFAGSVFEDGYGQICRKILCDRSVTVGAQRFYTYLSTYCYGGKRTAYPGHELICQHLGITPDTLATYILNLRANGYLTVTRTRKDNGQWGSYVYTLNLVLKPDEAALEAYKAKKENKRARDQRSKDKTNITVIQPHTSETDTVGLSGRLPHPSEADMAKTDSLQTDTNITISKDNKDISNLNHHHTYESKIDSEQQLNDEEDITDEVIRFQQHVGIDMRPKSRQQLYKKWRFVWYFTPEMINRAGEIMCKRTNHGNMEYIDTVLSNWRNRNIRTLSEVDDDMQGFKRDKQQKLVEGSKEKHNNLSSSAGRDIYVAPSVLERLAYA